MLDLLHRLRSCEHFRLNLRPTQRLYRAFKASKVKGEGHCAIITPRWKTRSRLETTVRRVPDARPIRATTAPGPYGPLLPRLPVDQHAGQLGHLGNPAAVGFQFRLDFVHAYILPAEALDVHPFNALGWSEYCSKDNALPFGSRLNGKRKMGYYLCASAPLREIFFRDIRTSIPRRGCIGSAFAGPSGRDGNRNRSRLSTPKTFAW